MSHPVSTPPVATKPNSKPLDALRRATRATPGTLWSVGGLIAAIVAVIFLGDLLVPAVTERWWQHRLGVWSEILLDDAALSLLCAAALVPVLRGWQRRVRIAERAMDIASDGFLVARADGQLLRANDGYRTMTGLDPQALTAMKLVDLQHQDSPIQLADHLAEAQREGVSRAEALHARSDGASIPVQLTTAWLADVGCFAAFVRDESARVAIEDRLREQGLATRRLLDAMAEGVLGFDDTGCCTFANRSAALLLGHRGPAALTGKPLTALFDGPAALALRGWLETTAPADKRELTMRRVDGGTLVAECAWHPIEHEARSQGHVLTFIDIGERVRARAERDQTMQQLHDTFELAPVGMARMALDGRFLGVNSVFAELLGMERDKLLASRWQDVTPLDDVAVETAGFQSLMRGEMPRFSAEKRYRRTSDGFVWVLQAVALVRDGASSPSYFIAVAKDIGARKAAEAALRAADVALRANAAKTQFLSRMSHELRTPLNAVLGYAQLLRMDPQQLSPDAAHKVDGIEQAGIHLLALINDVLDLSRIEAGQLAVAPECVDLNEVCTECVGMLRTQAEASGIELQPQQSGDRPAMVLADRLRLRQVLINLLSNAIKYSQPGGRVIVDWTRLPSHWEVRVVDDGIGMSEVQLAHLFEPFNRLGAERSGIEGTGIGLALARHLAELMGGELHVRSSVGIGTSVSLTLRLADSAEVFPAAARAPVRPAPLRALRLLYVEDNEVNIELIRGALHDRPTFDLRIARSGAQALMMARTDPPQLMLVDMHLGDTTGLELASVLQGDVRTRGIRLVALSADALPEMIESATRQGFEAYLTKPVDFARLLALLDSAAGS